MTQTARLEVIIDSQHAERNARMLGNELINIEQRGDYAGKSMDNLSVSIRKLTGFMASIITANQAIAKADGYTQFADRIRNATDSAEEYDYVQKRLFASTKSTFRALAEAQEVYLGLAGGMKALGYQTKETLDVADSLSFAFTANAARADQAQSAIDSFNKSMAKGKIDADAWISIVTAADNIIADMAKTTGKSETEIRKLGATGKISLEELIRTLKLTKEANQELADNIDNSLADGLTSLSNAVSKVLGELNMSTGATNSAAAGLGMLADNLETVTNVAMIGGAYWLATYIPGIVKSGIAIGTKTKELGAQVTVQYAAIQAERAAAAQELLSAQARANNLKSTIAVIQAEKALEVARLKGQISEKGRNMSLARMIELKKVESQVTKELTIAENTLTAAKTRATAAGAASMGASRALLGVLGGPVGLGLTVASVAATYLLFRDNTDKATKSLNENGKTVEEIIKKYEKLDEVQKRTQLRAEEDSFKHLSEMYSDASRQLTALTLHLHRSGEASSEIAKQISELAMKYKEGKLTAEELANQLNELNGITENGKSKIDEQVNVISNLRTQLHKQKNITEEMINQSKRSVDATNAETQALNEKRLAQQKLLESAKQNIEADNQKNRFLIDSIKSNGGDQKAVDKSNYMVDFYAKNNISLDQKLSDDLLKVAQEGFDLQQQAKKVEEDALKIKEQRYKYSQQEVKMMQKVQQLMSSGGLNEYAKQKGVPTHLVAGLMAQESKGERFAKSPTGAIGYFQTTSDYRKDNKLSVNDSYDLTKVGKVVIDNLAKVFADTGDWSTAILSHNAGVAGAKKFKKNGQVTGNEARKKEVSEYVGKVDKWSSYAAGSNNSVFLDTNQLDKAKDYQAFLEEAKKHNEQVAKNKLQLEMEVADKVTQIRSNLSEKFKEIDKAEYSDKEAIELKAKYQLIADNEVAIAQQAIKSKIDDYSDYLKTEEQLLADSFARRQFDAAHDLELTAEDRKKAVELLGQQFKQEQALIALAYEHRLFQARQTLMTESEMIRERYRLEREEIFLNSKISDEEKKKLISYSKASQEKELNNRLKNSSIEMARINSEMSGSGQLFEINQTKASRYQANENWYDSETAVIDHNEGSQIEELQRQFDEKLLSQQDFEDQKTAIILSALEQREAAYNQFKDNENKIDTAAGQAQLDFYIGQTQATLGAFQGMFGAILGEQSSAYRAMYAAGQAFALAQAGMNLWKSASDAYAAEPGTVWQKAGAALKATIDQGTMIAMIQAATPKGFSDGGYTGAGGKYDEAGVVHKGEVVWSQEDIKRWGGVSVVEAMRKNSPLNYSSGGVVSNENRLAVQRDSRQLDSIQQAKAVNQIPPKVTIINQTTREVEATTEWDGEELKIKLEEFKKQNEMMMDRKIQDSWRNAERQGGALSKFKMG
ncbi:hypothetical protein F889_01538 [Acinetobacter colistiniresistens]|uniref:Uncharacterized protein n=1 Tax=Acinetobacter colistiniresistens TaxID=280145 RepID=N9PN22_9GAMM|nr:tape measure protein [Acinetobacter colistiniresistens]ENX34898.1 hypothetical protein F889_01538 [Acinetobacter colistiniresistens]